MPRRSSLLPALVAVGVTAAGSVLGVPASSHPAAPAAAPGTVSAVAPAAPAEPLRVEITSLNPSYVPDRGTITLTGTVTNTSEKRWRLIRVYAFMSDTPMRSSAELDAAVATPTDAVVGDRILLAGTFDELGRLASGESTDFTVTLRRNQLPAAEAGVYWFGAHALGTDSAATPDPFADGRARTFLPLVPPSTRGSLKTAVVIPVRRAIRHLPDGRIGGTGSWADDLDDGGRLRSLVELGAAAGSTPVSWLIDPAVPDAVARLVAGNPQRTLADTVPPTEGEPTETGGTGEPDPTSPSATGDGEPSDPEEPADPEARVNAATEPGTAWLDRFGDALADDEVLALPYGDLDVAAAAANAPDFHELALGRVGTVLDGLGLVTEPAVAGADGFLPPESLYVLEGEETVLLSDAALSREEPLTSAVVEGREVLFASSAVASGGPGPGDPRSEIALRQRLLAEAAARLLFHDRTPLLVVLPDAWRPESPSSFWSGLDPDWLDLTDTDGLGSGTGPEVPADDVATPVEQELTALDPENFEAAEDLIEVGRLLDTVLPRNDRIASQTFDEALTSLSYSQRDRAPAARSHTLEAVSWIERRLGRIRVRAPRGVTLSSTTGSFPTLVTNRLDHPVRVLLQADSLGDVTVESSAPLELAAGSRQTVLLNADAGSPGVHYVRIRVTDEDGNPLGAARRVAIRSAEVSQVIWVILGLGVGLLFVAIGVRVVRRVRRERA